MNKNTPIQDWPIIGLSSFKKDQVDSKQQEITDNDKSKQIENKDSGMHKISGSSFSVKPSDANNKGVIAELGNTSKDDAKDVATDQLASPKKLLLARETVTKLMQYLRTTYPKCFTTPPSPLAIGIHKELVENELSKDDTPFTADTIRKILRVYTSSYAYKKALVLDADRLDLNGKAQSQVIKEQLQLGKWKKLSKQKDESTHQTVDKKQNKNKDTNTDTSDKSIIANTATDNTEWADKNTPMPMPRVQEQVKL